AGALAISRRHCRTGPQGLPVHRADRFQRPSLRDVRAGGGVGGEPRGLSHRVRQAARGDRASVDQGHRRSDRAAAGHRGAVPRRGHNRRRSRARRQGARWPAGADLDARMGQCALSLGRPLHHQGSRHRRAERRQLPRPVQGAAPARYESFGRTARRFAHWQKCKARGEPLPCAVVVGCHAVISYTSVQKMPEHLDELAVAGALAGGPINVVRAKTVDLLVPAEAEIVIEGLINTEWLEPGAPFGESHGYVNLQEYNAFMEVTAITRRREAILTSFISQVTPSESSVIRQVAMEPVYLHHLRSVLGIAAVKRGVMHEPLTSLYAVIA